MIEIKYDTEIEVTKEQFLWLSTELAGVVAYREADGKFYIKVLLMRYAHLVDQYLNRPVAA